MGQGRVFGDPLGAGEMLLVVGALTQSFVTLLWVGVSTYFLVSMGVMIQLLRWSSGQLPVLPMLFGVFGLAVVLWVNQIFLLTGGVGMVVRSRWAPSMFSSALTWNIVSTLALTLLTLFGFNIMAASTTAFLVLLASAVVLLLPLLAARVYFRDR